ncbi:MAG: site-specific integrase [Octadecabacter sp.]
MQNPTIENVRLRERKDGYFEVVWTENGKQKRRSTGTKDKNAAKVALVQIEAEIRAVRVPDAPTVGWIIDRYLENKKRVSDDPHDYAALISSLRPVKKRLGSLRWDQLTQSHIDDYATQRQTDKLWADHPGKRKASDKTISPSTVHKDLRMLRAALALAYAARYVPSEFKFKINVTPNDPKDVWLTKEEVGKMLDACEAQYRNRSHLYTFILISIASAARKEAVLELTWDMVHLTPDGDLNGQKLVDLTTGRVAGTSYIDFGKGKGNKRRPVMPIGQNFKLMWQLVNTRPAESTRDEFNVDLTENRVITFNGKPIKDVKKGFATLLKECGIDKEVTPHSLKHTSITWMVRAGIPFSTISDLTKTSEKVLKEVYSHHRPDYQAELGDALSL